MPHDVDDEDLNEEASGCGCGCFRGFGFKHWRRVPDVDNGGGGGGGASSWVAEKMRKAKEVTELIAGPKWKTFIRKLTAKKQNGRFQYDQHSYALNFNSGANSEDEAAMPPSFSARFSAPRSPPQS